MQTFGWSLVCIDTLIFGMLANIFLYRLNIASDLAAKPQHRSRALYGCIAVWHCFQTIDHMELFINVDLFYLILQWEKEGGGGKEPVLQTPVCCYVFQRKILNAFIIIKTLYSMIIIHSSCANEYASLMHTWKEYVQRQRWQWRRTLTSAFNKYCSLVSWILIYLNVFRSACWIIMDHQNGVGQHQTSIWSSIINFRLYVMRLALQNLVNWISHCSLFISLIHWDRSNCYHAHSSYYSFCFVLNHNRF